MDIETLIRESKAEALSDTLGIQTESGKAQFTKQLRLFSSHIPSLQRRSAAIMNMRETMDTNPEMTETLQQTFEEVATLEKELQSFFTESTVEKDSFEQLTFSGWKWAHALNTVPFVILAMSYFKLYVVPGMALLTPVFMLVMPYILLRFFYVVPLTIQQYIDIMFRMLGIQNGEIWTPKNMLQAALTIFSVGQSIYQPIQNAIHLQTINKDLIVKGETVEKLAACLRRLTQFLEKKPYNPFEDMDMGDPHKNFATTWDNVFRLHVALQTLGDLEVVYCMARFRTLRPTMFHARQAPCLLIKGGVDPFMNIDTRVPFDVSFVDTKSHHGILTGPNRGGKSSVLRSTLLSVLFAQTFGLGFLQETGRFHLHPFDWIATGLRLEDRPGKTSMFEREVEFAAQIIRRATNNPNHIGLILFDELFHSTNPPDGAHTATIFLEKLWKKTNIVSFISTHVFALAKAAPSHVQRLCVPAIRDGAGNLNFTYRLKRGVCEVSSVSMILKEKKLI